MNMEQLRAENVQLAQQLAALTAQVQQLQAGAGAAPVVVQAPPPRRRYPGKLPDNFDGTLSQFPAFIGQCELYMAMRPEEFPNDQVRVGFILGLLSGPAARWAVPFLNPANPLHNNYAQFLAQMRLMYEDPVKAQTASRRLKNLRQGKSSIQVFIQEFRLASQDSTWNESALMSAFQDGLSDEFQDELIRLDPPETMDALVLLCLRIDAKLQLRRSNKPRWGLNPARPVSSNPRPAVEPMELGAARPRLSVEEKDRRRRLGLCLYCGDQGHFSATCPRKKKSPTLATTSETIPPENE